MRLGKATGAKLHVVKLFAVLHDSCRESDGHDPQHGLRAADFAAELLRDGVFELSDKDFALLYRACRDHTHKLTDDDVTVRTCFDADRLDLGRARITPEPSKLCTKIARDPSTIRWAHGRAAMDFEPDFVAEVWRDCV